MMKMMKMGILVVMMLVLSVSAVSAAMFFKDIPLQPAAYHAGGTGQTDIQYAQFEGGTSRTIMHISLRNVTVLDNMKYQVWLIDEDSDYYNLMKTFYLSPKGNTHMTIKTDSLPLFTYDKILITYEEESDFDQHPSNPIMEGSLEFNNASFTMITKLTGRQEIPMVRTPARGDGIFRIDTASNSMYYDITLKNLETEETGAHIHGFALPGEEAGVMFSLPLGNHIVGVWNYPQDLEEQILLGHTYINIHTEKYPDGEIRGQLNIK